MITGINFSRCFNPTRMFSKKKKKPTRIEWDSAIIETQNLKLKLENNNNIKMVVSRYSNNWCILHKNTARMDEEFHTAAFHSSP